MKREGEDLISETERQDSCREGRREKSNSEKTGSASKGRSEGGNGGETRAEADGGGAGEGVSYYILRSRNLDQRARKFSQVVEMALLTGGPQWKNPKQSFC